MYDGLQSSGLDSEGVIPIPPPHQQTGVGGGGVLNKVCLRTCDDQLPVPYGDKVLRSAIMPRTVGTDEIGGAWSSDKVTVLTGCANPYLVQRNFSPEEGAGDFEQWGGGRETLQGIPQSHPEGGENWGGLGPLGVGLTEELSWHLAVSLDHGPHGCLLGSITHRVNVHPLVISLRIEEMTTLLSGTQYFLL